MQESSNMCFGYLLESPHSGDSNKCPKEIFYEEIRIKQGLSHISLCPLRILYNSKFILMATSLRTNAVVVTSVHFITYYKTDSTPRYLFLSVYTTSMLKYECCDRRCLYSVDTWANFRCWTLPQLSFVFGQTDLSRH